MDIGGTSKEEVAIELEIGKTQAQQEYKDDRGKATKDDREKKRGYLILNPELDGVKDLEGMVVTRNREPYYDTEYRVVIDPALKGLTRSDTGGMQSGYWLEPQKEFDLAMLPHVIPGNESAHTKCHNAWMAYYRDAETLDRTRPHRPAYRGSRDVIINPHKDERYHSALMSLIDRRDKVIGQFDRTTIKQAKGTASREFDRELVPCECRGCRENRR